MDPVYRDGKICYIEIPTDDVARSAAFYGAAFGWETRTRGDGSVAFDDTVHQVSGTWTQRRKPAPAGLMVYIMVDDAEATCSKITKAGGEIAQPIGADAPEITAQFRDPAGNVLGIYQHREK